MVKKYREFYSQAMLMASHEQILTKNSHTEFWLKSCLLGRTPNPHKQLLTELAARPNGRFIYGTYSPFYLIAVIFFTHL